MNPPPSGGCPCCSYSSLDAFLTANSMTMKDLHDSVRNNLGMKEHVTRCGMPNTRRDGARKWRSGRASTRRADLHGWRISSSTPRSSGISREPDGVRKRAKAKAMDAWRRLQKGEDFATVARKRSEDSTSRSKGGGLGCIPTGTFGKDVQSAFEAAKPGEYTPPVESPWGFHVIRCERLTEADVEDVLRTEYRDHKDSELYATIRTNAVIQRFD